MEVNQQISKFEGKFANMVDLRGTYATKKIHLDTEDTLTMFGNSFKVDIIGRGLRGVNVTEEEKLELLLLQIGV